MNEKQLFRIFAKIAEQHHEEYTRIMQAVEENDNSGDTSDPETPKPEEVKEELTSMLGEMYGQLEESAQGILFSQYGEGSTLNSQNHAALALEKLDASCTLVQLQLKTAQLEAQDEADGDELAAITDALNIQATLVSETVEAIKSEIKVRFPGLQP